MSLRPAVACLVVFLTSGCSDRTPPLRVASSDFAGQRVLAEMMAQVAEARGFEVERVIPYGDSRMNLAALEQGVIDAYPEYDGTLLALSGAAVSVDEAPTANSVRDLVAPLGLRWLAPFGLEDEFVVVVRRDVAIRRNLSAISDLAGLARPLRVAADRGYVARAVDGLYPLARRHGFEIGEVMDFPVGKRDPLFDALANNLVDLAIVFGSDSRLDDYVVAPLKDELNFFPKYHPAPLVREAALRLRPGLADAWDELRNQLDTPTMRRLTTRMDQSGEDHTDVARGHLESIGLLPAGGAAAQDKAQAVSLAVPPMSRLGYLPMQAAGAIRNVMPARRLIIQTSSTPARDVRDGVTRFGLVGSEELYQQRADGGSVLIEGLEVVGVVGTRLAHVIARVDSSDPETWRRLAVEPPGSGAWRLGGLLLTASGLSGRVELVPRSSPEELAELLRTGSAEAAVVMAERGHPGLLRLMQNSDLRIVRFPDFWGESISLRHPYLRPARLPANTYPHQPDVIETVSAQAVLATRIPPAEGLLGSSGPGVVTGIFTRLPQRLPFDTARRISAALSSPELPDPLLRVSPGLRPDPRPTSRRLVFRFAPALLNVLALAFVVAILWLYRQPLPATTDFDRV